MRITRIHADLDLVSGADVWLPDDASNHVLKVLRLRVGDILTVFSGHGGEYRAELIGATKHLAQLRIGEHRAVDRESPLRITLLQGISRGERMDYVVQKATELSVTRIVPIMTEFSVVKLDEHQAARRLEHWRAIVVSACEQNGRNRLTEIAPVTDLTTACGALADTSTKLLLSPTADHGLVSVASGLLDATLLIGPEGGLSEREEQLALRCGFRACRLGPRIFRTETAPVAAIALLQGLSGDLAN